MAQAATVAWHGEELKRAMRKAAARGIYLWAEHVLEESRRIVPHDEGTLERAGTLVPAGPGSLVLSRRVVYDTPYAARQHEDLTYRHSPGRHAKYLEVPLEASRDMGARIIAEQQRRVTA
jgi:hypothetical protein